MGSKTELTFGTCVTRKRLQMYNSDYRRTCSIPKSIFGSVLSKETTAIG